MVGNRGSAELSCVGDEYYGHVEPMAQELRLRAIESGVSGFGGLHMADHFKGPVIRPGVVWSIQSEPNMPILDFTMAAGSRKATPLLCVRVKEAIESAKAIQSAYANVELILEAEKNGLGGHTAKEEALIDFNSEERYPSSAGTTYRLMVQKAYRSMNPTFLTELINEPYESGVAGTDAETCEVYDAAPVNRDGTCRAQIEIIAFSGP